MSPRNITTRHATAEPAPPLRVSESTTIGQLVTAINDTLEAEGLRHLIGESDGLSVFPSINRYPGAAPKPATDAYTQDTPIKSLRARWLVCYAVPGSNEGEYLTLAAIIQPSIEREMFADSARALRRLTKATNAPASVHLTLATGKTFTGMRGATEAAARISELLEEWGHQYLGDVVDHGCDLCGRDIPKDDTPIPQPPESPYSKLCARCHEAQGD